MSKQQAYNKLIKDYTNANGHITLKPARFSNPKTGNYDSENPNNFTGQAAIVCKLNGLDISQLKSNSARSVQSVMVLDKEGREIKGLFSRQPESYKSNNPVSHDEYSGICFTSSVITEFRDSISADIVDYGKEYGWCYDDTNPKVNPIKQLKYNIALWYQIIIAFIKKDREKYPTVNTLTHRRLPDEIAYYKMISNKHKSNFLEGLAFGLSLFFSVRKPKGSTSGKIINWNKICSLELIGYNKWYITPFVKYFRKRLKKDYGEDYVNAMYCIYYTDGAHPFRELTKGLK